MYAGKSQLGKNPRRGKRHQAGGEALPEVHGEPAATTAAVVDGRGETCVLGTLAACCKAGNRGEAMGKGSLLARARTCG